MVMLVEFATDRENKTLGVNSRLGVAVLCRIPGASVVA